MDGARSSWSRRSREVQTDFTRVRLFIFGYERFSVGGSRFAVGSILSAAH